MTLACYAFLESQNQLNQLPDCDSIINVTGTPLPAFLPVSCAYGPTDAGILPPAVSPFLVGAQT